MLQFRFLVLFRNFRPNFLTDLTKVEEIYLFKDTLFKSSTGSLCKHQYLVWKKFGAAASLSILPVSNPYEKQTYGYIANGKNLDVSYYEGLHGRYHIGSNEGWVGEGC